MRSRSKAASRAHFPQSAACASKPAIQLESLRSRKLSFTALADWTQHESACAATIVVPKPPSAIALIPSIFPPPLSHTFTALPASRRRAAPYARATKQESRAAFRQSRRPTRRFRRGCDRNQCKALRAHLARRPQHRAIEESRSCLLVNAKRLAKLNIMT